VIPFLIGDIDTRPFKKFINWDEVSFYSNSASYLNALNSLTKSELLSKGKKAAIIWKEKLTYQKWCQYVIQELNELK